MTKRNILFTTANRLRAWAAFVVAYGVIYLSPWFKLPPPTIVRRLCAAPLLFAASCIIFLAVWLGYGLNKAKFVWRFIKEEFSIC